MYSPEKSDFPQWMFQDPWETEQSFLLDARETAVQIKLAVYALKMEPALRKIRLEAIGADHSQTLLEVAERIDANADALLDIINSLCEFRNAVKQQPTLDD